MSYVPVVLPILIVLAIIAAVGVMAYDSWRSDDAAAGPDRTPKT